MNKKLTPYGITAGALLVFVGLGLVYACASAAPVTSSSVSPDADFSEYTFATIELDDTGEMSVHKAELQNALLLSGYYIIDVRVRKYLSNQEELKLIKILPSISSTKRSVAYTINITDYLSGSLLASFNCTLNAGMGMSDELRIQVRDDAIREMEKVIKKL
jgi:hypothetical protein